jgi:hypothetical protein
MTGLASSGPSASRVSHPPDGLILPEPSDRFGPVALLGFWPFGGFPFAGVGCDSSSNPLPACRRLSRWRGSRPVPPRPASRCCSPRKSVVRRRGMSAAGTRSSPGFSPLQGTSRRRGDRFRPPPPSGFERPATGVVCRSRPSESCSTPGRAVSAEKAVPPGVSAPARPLPCGDGAVGAGAGSFPPPRVKMRAFGRRVKGKNNRSEEKA